MTNAAQAAARRKAYDEKAKSKGWLSMAEFLLVVLRGEVELPTCPPKWVELRNSNPSRLPKNGKPRKRKASSYKAE